jgi:hypothetical protein
MRRHRQALMLYSLSKVTQRRATNVWWASSRHVCTKQGGNRARTGHSSIQRTNADVPQLKAAGMTPRSCVSTAAAHKTAHVAQV